MNFKSRKNVLFILFMLFLFQDCSKADEKIYSEALPQKQSSGSVSDEVSASRQNAITRAVKAVSPAVVGINVTEVVQYQYRDPFFDDPFFRRFFGDQGRQGRTRQYEVHGLGSGFIISPDGYILTNHHVAGNASKIIVTMTDGKKYDAQIIGADMTTDVALLKIDAKDLPFIRLANSDDVIIGEWAIAFGNPFGLFDLNAKPTVTLGVVSNTGVNFTQENRVYKNMIQTDAAISSGNSGGPLVNANGEAIGINTLIFSTAQTGSGAGSIGIGWAIPMNRVKKVVDVLAQNKKINRNFTTGMVVREIDEQIVRYLKLDIDEGVVVTAVERHSPADDAGIEPGDVILQIDNNKIIKNDDYYIAVGDAVAGQKLNILILRDGQKLNKTLELKSRQ